jgi:hypothetical protein
LDSIGVIEKSDKKRMANNFLSNDESLIYGLYHKTYLGTYQISSNSIIAQKDISEIGPTTPYKTFDDGRKGRAIIGYELTGRMEDTRYLTYDISNNKEHPAISFPWRSEAYLSSNADYLIIERVDFEKPGKSDAIDYHIGTIYIFNPENGKLLRRLVLPDEGIIYIFDNRPDTIYYFKESTKQSYLIDLKKTSSDVELLDSLVSMKSQAFTNNWLGDQNFVNELDTSLANARNYLNNGDSSNCYRQLQIFQQKVNDEYIDSLDGDNKWINIGGWKQLYFNAGYILDRLPQLPKDAVEPRREGK